MRPNFEELEREAAKFRTEDQLHQSDQSMHAQEIFKLQHPTGMSRAGVHKDRGQRQKKK